MRKASKEFSKVTRRIVPVRRFVIVLPSLKPIKLRTDVASKFFVRSHPSPITNIAADESRMSARKNPFISITAVRA